MIHYNPLDEFYKSQIGAVCAENPITFRVKVNFDSVLFVLQKDSSKELSRFEMKRNGDVFEIELNFEKGLYFYYFDLQDGRYLSLSDDYLGEISSSIVCFQLTVYIKEYSVPEWIYGGIIYQIFPDRFFRAEKNKSVPEYKILHDNWLDTPIFEPNEFGKVLNNDFFGGDLKGIIKKLDYIKSLGVTVIYLNPIFEAYSNHRYDTGDYMKIDALLGDESDLVNLIKEAGQLGIKIILDGVFNHTGDDSVYFNKYGRYASLGAYQSKDSDYYSWYNFIDYPNKYDAWWGIETLPAINESNSDYVNYITGENGVIDHYMKLGLGGWRLDVVDELPSEFLKKIRHAVKNVSKNGIVIGEVWEDASNKISYGKRREYLQGDELDSAMNYPVKEAIIEFVKYGNSDFISSTIKTQLDHYPHVALHAMMNLLSTHDTARLLTVVGGKEPNGMSKSEMSKTYIDENNILDAKFKLKVASLLQFTLCGVPSIYYGDEIGMQGYIDPLNRLCYPWGKEDKEILEWYKKIALIRNTYSAFNCGRFEEIFKCDGVYVFKRYDDVSEVLIAVNISNETICLEFDGKLTELLSGKEFDLGFDLTPKALAVLVKRFS